MSRTPTVSLLCAVALATLPASALAKGALPEPDVGPDPRGLTIAGTGFADVRTPSRITETTIARAVDAAKPAAFARAVADARRRAEAVAFAAGLTLGAVEVVAERDAQAETGYYQPSRYCFGTRRRRCTVPPFAAATLMLTFATTQTSAAQPAGRAMSAAGSATVPVRPRNRRSSASIRSALLGARVTAGPAAFAAARLDATTTAQAIGATPGALFSIAEVRRPFDDITNGSFGPGRYCGLVTRRVWRRDPATGRRRVVSTFRSRRCFYSRETLVALRLTYLPA